jgi:hypothetical protein
MTRLAETYIHLRIDASEKFKIDSEEYLRGLSQTVSSEIFGKGIEVSIRFENGSWKTWITVAGAIYIGIGQYGSFRSGIDYLVKDARKFSNTVIEHFVQKKEVNQDLIFKTERRLCVPGKIQHLYQRIDSLQHLASKSDKNELHRKITKIKTDIIKILQILDHDQDRSFFVKSLNMRLSNIYFKRPMITINKLPDIQLEYEPPNLIGHYPLTTTTSFSMESVILPRAEAVIKEDEVDKLIKIIQSGRFDINID